MALIQARGLRKAYGSTVALAGVNFTIEAGRIVGLVGPNGAGKTTALNALLGLTACEGELSVLGLHPWRDRRRLMHDVCFIADVAVLPRWMRVSQALGYAAGMHPRFHRARAEVLLARTRIRSDSRVSQLSKGMVTQLHLAIAMAVGAWAVETVTAGTNHVGLFLRYRLSGAALHAFSAETQHEAATQLSQLTPGPFFVSPGLWLGLVFAAGFLAVATELRRRPEIG